MGDYDTFKTTLMGGFDKEDVMIQVQNLKDEAYSEQKKLTKEIKEKDARIDDLKKQLAEKDDTITKPMSFS